MLANGVLPTRTTEDQRVTMANTRLTVVGVAVGTEPFERDFLQEAVHGESAKLVRALVLTNDALSCF